MPTVFGTHAVAQSSFFNDYLLPELEKTFTGLKFTWKSDSDPLVHAHRFLGHAEGVSSPSTNFMAFSINITVSYFAGQREIRINRQWSFAANLPGSGIPLTPKA